MPIQRQACFKVKSEDDIPKMMDAYSALAKTHERDGKPYLLAVEPRATIADSKNQGYNFVATTQYAALDDVEYYDNECEAHKKLKMTVKDLVAGPPLALMMEV